MSAGLPVHPARTSVPWRPWLRILPCAARRVPGRAGAARAARQPCLADSREAARAAASSEAIGQSVLLGVTCNGGRCRAGPSAGGAGTPSELRAALCDGLDSRDGGPTTRIHINGYRGPAPLEPAAGVSRRLRARGSDSAD